MTDHFLTYLGILLEIAKEYLAFDYALNLFLLLVSKDMTLIICFHLLNGSTFLFHWEEKRRRR